MNMPSGAPRVPGFTLVETLATILIVAVLAGVSAPVISAASRNYADGASRAEIAAGIDAAMERIVSELRAIPLQAGATTAKPDISSITASSVTWSANSSIDLSGGTLRLTLAGGSPRTLLTGVSDFSIRAYDASGTALTTPLSGAGCDAVQRLEVTVTGLRHGVSETHRTRVFLRNLAAGASP